MAGLPVCAGVDRHHGLAGQAQRSSLRSYPPGILWAWNHCRNSAPCGAGTPGIGGAGGVGEIAFLTLLSTFIVVLSIGVVRRWRWTFWLILVAFLFGVLRVPVAILQLTSVLTTSEPSWYVLFQGLIGLVQFAIGLGMLIGYRRSGVWGTV